MTQGGCAVFTRGPSSSTNLVNHRALEPLRRTVWSSMLSGPEGTGCRLLVTVEGRRVWGLFRVLKRRACDSMLRFGHREFPSFTQPQLQLSNRATQRHAIPAPGVPRLRERFSP